MKNEIPKTEEKYIGKGIPCHTCNHVYTLDIDSIAYFIYLKLWKEIKERKKIPTSICGHCND
ncbi:unnamed protein product [marine sediment metagenome]|uniref:Zinc-binding domain-containing protein n=1 Tax=marine sediment metagenome TaxID=412755 RepID=X0UQ08_9ZZZZ